MSRHQPTQVSPSSTHTQGYQPTKEAHDRHTDSDVGSPPLSCMHVCNGGGFSYKRGGHARRSSSLSNAHLGTIGGGAAVRVHPTGCRHLHALDGPVTVPVVQLVQLRQAEDATVGVRQRGRGHCRAGMQGCKERQGVCVTVEHGRRGTWCVRASRRQLQQVKTHLEHDTANRGV